MILLHVIAKNEKQAEEISDFLLIKKFVLDTVIVSASMNRLGESNKVISDSRMLVMGKTRALLFDKIEKAIHRKYESQSPVVYSLPIVNMDWDHANELQAEVQT